MGVPRIASCTAAAPTLILKKTRTAADSSTLEMMGWPNVRFPSILFQKSI
jgi:hypothetical protein